jgi:hypothetical protein
VGTRGSDFGGDTWYYEDNPAEATAVVLALMYFMRHEHIETYTFWHAMAGGIATDSFSSSL